MTKLRKNTKNVDEIMVKVVNFVVISRINCKGYIL